MNGEAVWRYAETLGAWAWRASWQGAALAAIVALVLWLAGRKISPAWRFGLWGLVLLRLAMPTVVAWEQSERPAPVREQKQVAHVTAERPAWPHVAPAPLRDSNVALPPVIDKTKIEPRAPRHVETTKPHRDLAALWRVARWYAIAGWLLGIALLAARVAWLNLRLARAVGRMPAISDNRVSELLRNCCDELRIARLPELRQMPGAGAPALVGCRRPTILLPVGVLEGLGDEELRLILMHELAHVKRRDVLVNWLATLVALLHWPNPAVWGVLWRMRVEREMACDEMVMRAGRGAAYGRTIVRLAETLSLSLTPAGAHVAVPAGAVGILEGKAELQRRLLMIARFDAKRRRTPVLALGFGLLLGAVALSGATRAADPNEKTTPATPTAAQSTKSRPTAKATDPNKRATGQEGPAGSPAGAVQLDPRIGVGAPALPGAIPGAGGIGAAPTPPTGATRSTMSPATVTLSPEEEKANARTAAKLKKPLSAVKFEGQALADVVDLLRDTVGVDILVEWPALEQMGVTRDNPVTLQLHDPTPVDAVLPLMFRAMGVDVQYEIDKGVVVIGPGNRRPALVVRVYDVGDLLSKGASAGGGVPGDPAGGQPWGGSSDAAQLTHLIMATVSPDSWQESGGGNTMTVFKNKLVVKAPEPEQKEIVSLLEMLTDKPATPARTTERAAPRATEKDGHRVP